MSAWMLDKTVGSGITYRYINVDARQGEPAVVVGGGVRHVCSDDVAVIRSAVEGSRPNKRITREVGLVCIETNE
jgi:hypothetical protein